ncbi:MAG: nitrous oxide reductase family maturation protein NosD [Acidobacteriia bacterium]|nr:nitrous oxide reductase family maturation protein NosD [Terriglobia bacterium]
MKLLALALAAGGPWLFARTLAVNSTFGPIRSIREAVAQAAPGDTIQVEPGTYQGNLTLDRQVVLEGTGRPVIHGDGNGSVITVLADRSVIRGFVVEHSGTMLVDEDSGILLKSGGNLVANNELRDVLFGVYFFHADGNTVADNTLRGRAWLEAGERGSGIHIWNSSGNTILRNVIFEMRDGMYLQNAYRSVISGNRVSRLRYGLHYMFSDDNRFEDNDFYDNVAGAAIMYSRRIQFRRNSFVHNRGFSSFGILFQDSHDCIAEDNTISDNAVGIFMETLTDTVFRRNTIAGNDIAVEAFSSAERDTFTRNNFVRNLSPFQLIGKVTDIRWSEAGAGNYWSGYDGYDLNGDGIGDAPFRIQNLFEHLEANFPRLRIYLFSPASQALAASERSFPVLEPPRTFDPAPLMRPLPLGVREPERPTQPRGVAAALAISCIMLAASAAVILWGKALWSKSAA